MKSKGVWRQRRDFLISACLATVLAVGWAIVGVRSHNAAAKQHAHRSARPLLTGSDGSQTGLADFLGNFTTITTPAQSIFLIERQPDCSLTLYTGMASSASQPDVTATTPHYERMLHQEAGLATTAGVYTAGCSEPSTGISSRPVLSLGRLSNGEGIFAAARGMGTGVVAANFSSYTYTPHPSVPFVSKINTGDLNGDGVADLVAVIGAFGATAPSIAVLLGNADGTFANPVSYPTAGTVAAAAVVDDVNGDGRLDVVVVSADQQFSVLLGNGDGTLRTAQNFTAPLPPGQTSAAAAPIVNLITADLRGTHKKDLICSNGLVLLGNGDGTFTAATTAAFPYVQDNLSADGPNLATGDLNNDGKADLVVNNAGSITTWIGNGDGSFTIGQAYAVINDTGYVTVSDLDGDGNVDIYTGLANGGSYSVDFDNPNQSYVLMGNGDGTFQGAPEIQGQYAGNNMGDVNGDGLPDIITNTVSGFSPVPTFAVQLGTAAGPFHSASIVTGPASFTFGGSAITGADMKAADTFAVGDVNGDGKADLVWADNNLNGTTGAQSPLPVYFVALSNGDGTFAAPTPYAFPQIAPAGDYDNILAVTSVHIAQFTGSGHNDLVFAYTDQIGGTSVASPYTGGLVVLPGNGDGTFGAAVVTTTSSSASTPSTAIQSQIFAATDLTGDAKADLLVAVPNFSVTTGAASALEFFASNGDGTFKPPATITTAANPNVNGSALTPLVLADFNKDGKLDLACLGETGAGQAQLAISLGNGDGTFAAPTIFNLSDGDTIRGAPLAAADFNGDGNIDLALVDGEAYSGIFYGKGDGTFSSVNIDGTLVPKDLINLFNFGGGAIAVDLNHDGHPDLLAGNTIFLNIYGAAPQTITPAATTTALTASPSTVNPGANVTFTATVTGASGSSGTPTGTVTFLDGTATLGAGTLSSSGAATYSTTALAVGAHSITASYGGDTNFTASTSSAVTVTVVAVVVSASFTVGANPAALSVTAGQSGAATITVTPAGGFAQPVTFACSGLPSKSTCTFAPATVTPGTGPATTTLTIGTTAATTSVQRAELVLMAALLLFLIPAGKSRRGYALFSVVLLFGVLLGCGGGSSSGTSNVSGGGSGGTTTIPGTPSGTSTVTVTATAGSLSQTATIQLTVP